MATNQKVVERRRSTCCYLIKEWMLSCRYVLREDCQGKISSNKSLNISENVPIFTLSINRLTGSLPALLSLITGQFIPNVLDDTLNALLMKASDVYYKQRLRVLEQSKHILSRCDPNKSQWYAQCKSTKTVHRCNNTYTIISTF